MAFTAVSFEILRSLFRARRNLDTRAMVVQVFRVVGICGRGIVRIGIHQDSGSQGSVVASAKAAGALRAAGVNQQMHAPRVEWLL